MNRKRKHRSGPHVDFAARQESPPRIQFLGHHETYKRTLRNQDQKEDGKVDPLRSLYIQAHEAVITHGSNITPVVQSLEALEYRLSTDNSVEVVPKIGSALIQLGADSNDKHDYGGQKAEILWEKEDNLPSTPEKNSQTSIWVDRYDIRLLTDNLNFNSAPAEDIGPASPGGWSDIPSDAEDTFFFTPDEMEDFHREKRRKLLEKSREDRVKARMEEDGVDEAHTQDEDVWGGSDEEPDEVQKELMQRTALHLLSSPNPAQLEMRILANHGNDQRFSFLRGRWGHAWKLAMAKVRLEKEKRLRAADEPKPMALGVLAGYGSDSEDSDSDKNDAEGNAKEEYAGDITYPALVLEATVSAELIDAEELAREARRQRLKQWTEARRAPKDAAQSSHD